MANKTKDDDTFDNDGEFSEELEDLAFIPVDSNKRLEARHRLEQLREEKELERLINGNAYDDYF